MRVVVTDFGIAEAAASKFGIDREDVGRVRASEETSTALTEVGGERPLGALLLA